MNRRIKEGQDTITTLWFGDKTKRICKGYCWWCDNWPQFYGDGLVAPFIEKAFRARYRFTDEGLWNAYQNNHVR